MKPQFCLTKSIATLIAGSMVMAANVHALPKGETVRSGNASFDRNGGRLNIRAGDRAIIDYHSFNISRGEKVQFIQPGRNSTVLNRVTEVNPSRIFGTMEANGRIVLMNPYGIFFGNGAVINVGSLIAAAGNMSDADFLAGKGNIGLSGTVTNRGNITAVDGVSLYGTKVDNSGTITSQAGAIEMLAGSSVYVGETGGNIFAGAAAPAPRPRVISRSAAPVSNSGKLSAPKVTLAAGDAFGLAVAHSGDIKSQDVTLQAPKGIVVVSGRVDASNRAPGGTGGKVKFLGDKVTLRNAVVDASGDAGGGEVLVGGDFQGGNDIPTAKNTVVDSRSVILADAVSNGDGGKVILWADQFTTFGGTISARGGAQGGDGGLIETSGKVALSYTGSVDAAAPAGAAGTWLLDPTDITINATATTPPVGGSFGGGGGTTTYTPNAAVDSTQIRNTDITTPLNAGTNVVIQTASTGLGAGNITLDAPLAKTGGNAATLTFNAVGAILVNAGNAITNTSGNDLDVIFNAGAGITLNAGIGTGGGDIDLNAGGAVQINEALNAGAGNLSIDITGSGAVTQTAAGVITANTLSLSSTANSNVDLGTAPNVITTLGTTTLGAGSLALQDTGGLTVGGAVSANGGVSIATTGALTVSNPINSTGTVSLRSGGAGSITATAAAITAGTLSLETGAAGGATVNTAAHNVGIVQTAGTGVGTGGLTFAQSRAGGLAIGPITSGGVVSITESAGALTVSGIIDTSATGANVSLNAANNSLAVNSQIRAGTGTVTLLANQNISQANTAAGIAASALRAESTAGSVSLSPTGVAAADINTVTTFAAQANTGDVSFTAGATFSVGTVAPTVGISANSAGRSVSLATTSGNITQTQAITTPTLNLTTNGGNVTLNTVTNNVPALGIVALGAGALAFQTTVPAGFSLGATPVTANGGITVANTTGGISLAGDVTASGGSISLSAGAGAGITRTAGALSGSAGVSLTTGTGSIGALGSEIHFANGQTGVTATTQGGNVFLIGDGTLGVTSITTTGGAGAVGGNVNVSAAGLTVGAVTTSGGTNGGGIGRNAGSVTLASTAALSAGAITAVGSNGANGGNAGGSGGAITLSAGGLQTLTITGNSNAAGGTGTGAAADGANGNISLTGTLIETSGDRTLSGETITVAGTLSPGGAAPAQLTVNGNLTFTAGSSLQVTLNGTTAGTEFDLITVDDRPNTGSSTITLNSARLLGVPGFSYSVGDNVVFVANAGGNAVNGTFVDAALNNLPQDGSVTFAGQGFDISYTSTNGRSIRLRRTTTTWVWDGGAGNNNWTSDNNWTANSGEPGGGDIVHFAGNTRLTPVNNLPAGTVLQAIIFDLGAGAFVLGGNSVGLSTGITNDSGILQTINMGIALTGAIPVNTGAGSLELGGVISGAGSLLKSGTGVLSLGGANTFAGGVNLSAGTLDVKNNSALGTGTLTVANGTTIANTSGGALTLANQAIWDGDFVFNGPSPVVFTGNVTLTGSRNVNIAASTLGVNGVISGTGFSIAKTGAGALSLGGANTFGGIGQGVVLAAGQLNLNNAAALGDSNNVLVVLAGTTIDNTSASPVTLNSYSQFWDGDFAFGGTQNLNLGTGLVTIRNTDRVITTNGTATLTAGGVISGANFGLSKSGPGTLTLAAANTFGGPGKDFVLNAGTLNLNTPTALGDAANGFVINGGTLGNTTAGLVTLNPYSQTWAGDFSFSGPSALTLTGTASIINSARVVTVSAGELTQAGVISGFFGLEKAGPGTLTLSGANTFGFLFSNLTLSGGTLNLNNPSAPGSALNRFVINGGTIGNTSGAALTLLPYPQTWAGNFSFTGPNSLNLGAGIVTLTSSPQVTVTGSNTLTVGGIITDDALPPRSLTKAGTGTLILAGNNTYSGNTIVNGGTLQLGIGGITGSLGGGNLTGGGAATALVISRSDGLVITNPLTNFGSVEVLQSASVTFTGPVNVGSIILTNPIPGSTISFLGTTTATVGFQQTPGNYNVSFTGPGSTIAGSTTFTHTGSLTLGNIRLTGGATALLPTPTNLLGVVESTNAPLTFGPVTLVGAATVRTNATTGVADIVIGPITGNLNDLTLQTGAVAGADVTGTTVSGVNTLQLQSIGGTASFTGAVNANNFNVLGSVVNLVSTGTGGFITNNFVPTNSGILTLGQAGGTQTYNGGINTAGVGGLVTVNGTINTNDALLAFGAVTLGSATTLNTNAVTAAGDISLGAVTGANNNLTLRTGLVAGADVSATSVSGVNILQLQNIGGTASFTGAVTATTFNIPGSVVNVSSTGNGGVITTNFAPANTGTLTLGQPGGTQTYNGGINATGVGLVALNGTIATSDDLIALGAVALGSATTLNTNATTTAGDIILGAVTGGNNNLTLRTGAVADADVTGTSVSGVDTLQLQTIGGTASFTGAVIANTFNVPASVVNVISTGSGGAIANNFVPVNTGTLTLGQAGGIQSYNGGIDTTGVGSTVTLNGAIATSDDSLEFGPVTLGSATILDSNAISTSGDITLGAVTGGGNNLTLETGLVANADVNATSISGVNILQLQNIGGTANFNGAVTATTFNIPVSVVNVSSTGNGGVITTGFVPLNTGTLTLGQAGGTQTYNGGINTAFAGGLVTLNGTIATSDDAIALGAVSLGSDTILNTNAVTGAGDITLGAVNGGNNDLTLQTGTVAGADVAGTSVSGVDTLQLQNIGGTATFIGAVSADTFNVPATVVNVISTGTGGAIANNFVPVNTGILILGQAGGTQTYNGGIDTTGVGSTVTLNGLIAASDDALTFGPVTLGSATTLDTNATSGNGDITLGAVIGGGNNLTLETGSAANADVNATSISGVNILQLQNIGGTASFTGPVTATTFNIPNTVNNVSSTGSGGVITTFFVPQNTGDLTLGQPGGTQTYAAGFDTTGVGGTVILNGNFETINSPITLGDISLSSDLGLNTNATSAIATITIGNVTGNSFSLRLQTGAAVPANVTVASTVGLNVLQLLNIGGTALFTGPVSATTFNVPASVRDVASLGSGGVIQNQFVPQNSGTLILGQDGGTQEYTGGVNATGIAGVVTLNGIFTTASQPLTFGQILLGSDVALLTNGTNAAGSITIGNVAGAGHALNLNAGGLASITGADVNNVSTLTISNSANTTFTGTIGATIPGNVDLIDTTGTIAFQGNTHIVLLTTAPDAYTVAFTGTENRIEQPVTFANTGVLILGDGSTDRITFDQGVIATAPQVQTAGTIVIGGNFSGTFGSATKSITLAADTTFQSIGAGALDFEGTVDSGTGGPFALKIEKPSGVTPVDPQINKATFAQPVGQLSPLASLVITAGDGIVFEGAAKRVKTTGAQTYNNAVQVSLSGTPAPRTMTFESQFGDIVFNSTLTSNKATTIRAENLTFANNVKAISLNAVVRGVTTLGGSVPSMKVTTLTGTQAFSSDVNVLSNVTMDATTLTIGSLAVNGGKTFTVNARDISFAGGISQNDGFIILNPTATFVSDGRVNSDGSLTINGKGKTIAFNKIIEGDGILTVDAGEQGMARFKEKVSQGVITVDGRVISIAGADAKAGSLTLRAHSLLELTGESFKARGDVLFNNFAAASPFLLVQPDAGDATILRRTGDVVIESNGDFTMGPGEKFLVDAGSLRITAKRTATVGDLAAFATLFVKASTVAMQGREPSGSTIDGRKDEGLGFVGRVINFNNSNLEFVGLGPQKATFATETGFPLNVNRSLSNAGIAFETMDGFDKQFGQEGSRSFGQLAALSLLQPIANGVRAAEATETQTPIIENRPSPIVLEQNSSISAAVKEALNRMRVRPRDATVEESESMSLLRGLLKQPIEGRAELDDDDYKVVVNRLVNEEVERVLEEYLTLTSSYFEDWTKKMGTPRPKPAAFLSLAANGQIKGAKTLAEVYDKPVQLNKAVEELVLAYQAGDPNKDLGGFLEWLQGQRGDAKLGKQATFLAQNLDILAKVVVRLGQIGLTGKELDLSKRTLMTTIVGTYVELIPILLAEPPKPGAIPKVVAQAPQPEVPLTLDGPTSLDPLLPGGAPAPGQPSVQPPAPSDVPPAPPTDVPPAPPGAVPPPAPSPDAPAPAPDAATPPSPDGATPPAPPASDAPPAPDVPAAPGN